MSKANKLSTPKEERPKILHIDPKIHGELRILAAIKDTTISKLSGQVLAHGLELVNNGELVIEPKQRGAVR